MKKRVTTSKRAELEQRYAALKQAAFESDPLKIDDIVDRVPEDSGNIQDAVEEIMKKMQAKDDLGKYKVPAPTKTAAFKNAIAAFVKAFEFGFDSKETAEEETHDLHNPVLHPVEDLEEEVRTLDDKQLESLVEKIEELMKKDLNKEHAKEANNSEHESEKEMPKSDDKSNVTAAQRLANLLSAPKDTRLAKAAELRALAKALEGPKDEKEPKEETQEQPAKSDERAELTKELAKPYEDKDDEKEHKEANLRAYAKKLKKFAIKVLAELDDEDEKDEEVKDEKKDKKEASHKVIAKDLDESKGGKPNWLQEAEEKAEGKEDEKKDDKKEDEMAEKKARLVQHLQTLRKNATVDGRNMPTPKEVPKSEGTTEDTLKGDAKVQYQRSSGDAPQDEIFTKREKLPIDKEVAGTDEPKAIYQGNTSEALREPQTEVDSAKGVNNKRELKDMGVAYQPSAPHMVTEMSVGDEEKKPKDWEKAKSESDTTPSGPRLKGLEANEIIGRTTRALKLVKAMHQKGMVNTEDQFEELVARYASFDDDKFESQKELVDNTPGVKHESKPEAKKSTPVKHEEETEDEDDEKESTTASPIRRAGGTPVQKTASLTRPLVSFNDDSQSPRSALVSKIASMGWETPITKVQEQESLGLNLNRPA